MKKELNKLTTNQLIELVKTFEHYPAVTLKDGKDYILSYLEDEACTISKKEISEYLLKNGVEINQENIHLYYEFMSDEDLNTIDYDFIQNLDLAYRQHKVLGKIFETENSFKIMDLQHKFASYRLLSFKPKELLVSRTQIGIDYKIFGVKDTLKPIDEYIAEIKASEPYKIFTSECRCNNCMTYFESDDDLIDGEDEDGEFKGCPKCNTDKYLMNLSDLK